MAVEVGSTQFHVQPVVRPHVVTVAVLRKNRFDLVRLARRVAQVLRLTWNALASEK